MKSEKQLYQWDVNQHLTELQPTAQFVDYPMGNEVIRIETDGKRCRIPDEFLQTAGFKTCYERYSDGTYNAYNFNVQSSPKPPDYVYTAEERTTFDALVAKADAAIEEIKRRADSGEFTPVKGVDYFTEAEKIELMEGVSSGAVGEFRKVVDTATAEYNDNHNLQLAKYNANAAEKLTTYDTNAEQHTTDYNRNAEQKLQAYNQNHTEKVAEYNANAETKKAEFDSNAAALQTEVDRLRGECDTLATENRKQENRISALMKLNKGQTYDILTEDGEAASRTAPSGAKYVGIDKVGGKSLVWNQLFNVHETKTADGMQFVSDGQTVTMSGNSGSNKWLSIILENGEFTALNAKNHRYLYSIFVVENSSTELINFGLLNRPNCFAEIPANYTGKVNFVCTVTKPDAGRSIGFSKLQQNTDYNVRVVVSAFDLTLLFGAGNEPTAEQFEAMFPAESYPYNSGEIISARTETITAGAETITTGFPELRSAMAAHDYIDMDGGKVHRKIKSVRIDGETPIFSVRTDQDNCCRVVFTQETSPGIVISEEPAIPTNIISDKLATITHNNYWSANAYPGIGAYPGYASISMRLQDRTDLDTKEKVSAWLADNPMTVYYEINPEEVTDVAIPEPLQEWLPVEAGGTVTFRNADESKQLPVPNAVSWVRKLNEVE